MSPEPVNVAERQQRVEEVFLLYLKAVDAGDAPDPLALAARHPDLAEDLAALFADQEWLIPRLVPWSTMPPAACRVETAHGQAGVGSAKPPNQTAAATEPGSVPLPSIPGYEMLGELGRGGMGVVYKARQQSRFFNRIVALKIILAGKLQGAAHLARFRQEAEAIARLQHPHVLQIFDSGEHDQLPYIVMEHAEGGTLAQRIQDRAQPQHEAARLVQTLARAVHAIHQCGIIHRDLKPSNILLTRDSLPKIGDFGLALLRDGPETGSVSGTIVGTAGYMAPQQAQGKSRAVGPGADVWALGAILYELLTGRAPFQGATFTETLLQVVSEEPAPPCWLRPEVSAALEAICLRCLRKASAERFPTAESLAVALRQFLNDEPAAAGSGQFVNVRATSVVRFPTDAVGAASAGLGLTESANDAREPTTASLERPAPAARAPLASSFYRLVGGAALAALLVLGVAGYLVFRRSPAVPAPWTNELAPLQGTLDVLIYDPLNPRRQNLFLDDPGAMPLRVGDEFCIEVKLNRPAYMYVLWIDTDGQVQPVYPWRPGHWEKRPAEERPVARLRRPEALDEFYKMSKGTAGMETLVLAARETPLPHAVDLRAELGVLPRPAVQELKATAWFENGEAVRNQRGRAGLFDLTRRDDPVLMTQQRIKARLSGRCFTYTLAVSFANQGQ